jgi:putative DNA primase/helicase
VNEKVIDLTEVIDNSSSSEPAIPLSEDAIALRLVDLHCDRLRYVAQTKKWLVWDGTRWAIDTSGEVSTTARAICREVALEASPKSNRRAISSEKTKNAIISLAADDQRIKATMDQFDAQPMLLNTKNGVIDLRTGIVEPHNSAFFLTRITSVAMDRNCPTPQWQAFLDRSIGGNADLKRFLQRAAGYAITGSTKEHAMFFLCGLGGNGKGVFVRTLAGIMSEYHRSASIETFTVSKFERHPTEIAALWGARIVTASETEEGRPWAESRIKELTGGDKITARYMRKDFFDFFPQFKLIISGNHRPGLRSVDEAMRRRMNLIPFEEMIPKSERDPELDEKLKAEWPGILAWLIEGCLDWQKIGLSPPRAVVDATEEYLTSEDTFKTFLEECCEVAPNLWEPTANLFFRYKQWTEQSGEYVGTERRFAQKLTSGGFKAQRKWVEVTNGQRIKKRGFLGLKLGPQLKGPEMPEDDIWAQHQQTF